MTGARRAVAIGGGTGLPLVLRCLLDAGFDTTAVVTMADDGGSSGHLRRELGMLPPGDIRNCLAALADPASDLARVFNYRFTSGEGLAGHALGNLIIAALADVEGGFPEAVETAGRMLGVRGRVLPSTVADVVLTARDASGRLVTGQANVAVTDGPIDRVCMEPAAPSAYPAALEAIAAADLIVIGPGSLFTSIIPNFLVAGVADVVRASDARVVYVCNVANLRGETAGMDAADHVDALVAHGLEGVIDVALVDITRAGDAATEDAGGPAHAGSDPDAVMHVEAGSHVLERIEGHGIRVLTADLAAADSPAHHDRVRLLSALSEVW